MWFIIALLVLAAWTAIGFVAALLFFRLGFGFEVGSGEAEPQSLVLPERGRPVVGARHYRSASLDRRRRGRSGAEVREPSHGRLEHSKPVKAAG